MCLVQVKPLWSKEVISLSMTDKLIIMILTQKRVLNKLAIKAIYGVFLLLVFSNSIEAQTNTAAGEAKPVKEVFYDITFGYTLVGVGILLAFVIYILGNVFLLAIKNRVEEQKKNGTFTKHAVTIGLIVFTSTSINAQALHEGVMQVVSENVMYLIGVVILLELLIIFYLANGIRTFLKKESSLIEPSVKEDSIKIPKISWFDKLYSKNSDADIIKLDLGHDYDGIKELDNDIPIWWKYGFVMSFLFGIVYLYNYHIAGTRPLQQKELQIEQEIAEVKLAAYLEKSANNVDENTAKMLGIDDITSGKVLFIKPGACVTCHAANGSAIVNGAPGIGPNLTDDYWIHKGDIKSIFYSIKYGWPEKGMKSWKEDYSPVQIAQLASYVKSLHGTNPLPAKEKQGVLFIDSTSTVKVVDSAVVAKAN